MPLSQCAHSNILKNLLTYILGQEKIPTTSSSRFNHLPKQKSISGRQKNSGVQENHTGRPIIDNQELTVTIIKPRVINQQEEKKE